MSGARLWGVRQHSAGSLRWATFGVALVLAVALFGVAVTSAFGLPTSFTFVPLSGSSVCVHVVYALNDSGDAVGAANFLDNAADDQGVYGFRWDGGTFSELPIPPGTSPLGVGSSPPCTDGFNESVTDINDSGSVVGQAVFADPDHLDDTDDAALWPGGGGAPMSLGVLGVPSDYSGTQCETTGLVSEADAINNAGDVTGESTNCSTGAPDAFFLPAGQTLASGVDIGTVPDGEAEGVAINAADQVAIYNELDTNFGGTEQPSTLWSKNGTTKTLPFLINFSPNILNNSGVVVGTDHNVPVYSVNGGPEKQLLLPAGDTEGNAYGVDDEGDVVGNVEDENFGVYYAVVWPAAVPPATGPPPQPVLLSTLAPNAPVNLNAALSITDSGYILDEDANGYDELAPCSSSAAAADAQIASVAHAVGAHCPLKVFAKIVGPVANEGTRSGLTVDKLDSREGPVNFTIPTYSKTETGYAGAFDIGQKCVSGCANVLVTVIDPATGKPVANATVTATVGALGAAKSVSGDLAGDQFLCVQSDNPSASSCGTDLTGLSTDSAGELHLLYWAPGETATSTSSISVTAQKCSSTCSAGEQEGSAQTGVTITPYPIYTHNGTLSAAEVKSLIEVAGEGKLNSKSYAAARDLWFEQTIHWLAQQDKVAKRLVKAALGPLGYSLINLVEVGTLIAEGNTGLNEEKLLSGALLEAMEMPGIGLFDDPFEKQIPAQPNDYLRQAIIHGLGNADGIGGAGGVLWDLGKALIKQYGKHGVAVQPEQVKTTVDEISSCNPGNPNCGTGYLGSRGIRPRLCLILDFSNRVPGGDYGTHFCLSPYDPVAFATTQPHLDKSLPGS